MTDLARIARQRARRLGFGPEIESRLASGESPSAVFKDVQRREQAVAQARKFLSSRLSGARVIGTTEALHVLIGHGAAYDIFVVRRIADEAHAALVVRLQRVTQGFYSEKQPRWRQHRYTVVDGRLSIDGLHPPINGKRPKGRVQTDRGAIVSEFMLAKSPAAKTPEDAEATAKAVKAAPALPTPPTAKVTSSPPRPQVQIRATIAIAKSPLTHTIQRESPSKTAGNQPKVAPRTSGTRRVRLDQWSSSSSVPDWEQLPDQWWRASSSAYFRDVHPTKRADLRLRIGQIDRAMPGLEKAWFRRMAALDGRTYFVAKFPSAVVGESSYGNALYCVDVKKCGRPWRSVFGGTIKGQVRELDGLRVIRHLSGWQAALREFLMGTHPPRRRR